MARSRASGQPSVPGAGRGSEPVTGRCVRVGASGQRVDPAHRLDAVDPGRVPAGLGRQRVHVPLVGLDAGVEALGLAGPQRQHQRAERDDPERDRAGRPGSASALPAGRGAPTGGHRPPGRDLLRAEGPALAPRSSPPQDSFFQIGRRGLERVDAEAGRLEGLRPVRATRRRRSPTTRRAPSSPTRCQQHHAADLRPAPPDLGGDALQPRHDVLLVRLVGQRGDAGRGPRRGHARCPRTARRRRSRAGPPSRRPRRPAARRLSGPASRVRPRARARWSMLVGPAQIAPGRDVVHGPARPRPSVVCAVVERSDWPEDGDERPVPDQTPTSRPSSAGGATRPSWAGPARPLPAARACPAARAPVASRVALALAVVIGAAGAVLAAYVAHLAHPATGRRSPRRSCASAPVTTPLVTVATTVAHLGGPGRGAARGAQRQRRSGRAPRRPSATASS